MTKQLEDYLKLWEEPTEESTEKPSDETIQLKLEMPLKEGLLKVSMGIPFTFILTKSDIVNSSSDKKRFEEDSEFIIKHLRKFAITYGSSIIYTSSKQNINLALIYEYICHRMFGFDFKHKPNIIEKDAYFIPAGYDSTPLLASYDIQGDLSKIYNEKISTIKQKQTNNDEELICEDVQNFLKKFYGVIGTTSKTTKPGIETNSKINMNNYATNTNTGSNNLTNNTIKDDSIKQNVLTKGISTGKLPSNYKDLYGTNPTTSTGENKIDPIDKNAILDNIRKQELLNLTNKPSTSTTTENKETKPSAANDILKKRLDALKNNKKA